MITLPWPAKELSPNARVHWAQKSKAAKLAKQYAFVHAKEARLASHGQGKVTLYMEFVKPSKRRNDLDNMIASCKAYIDGIAEAIGIDDSRFRYVLEVADEPVKGGLVRVSIQP